MPSFWVAVVGCKLNQWQAERIRGALLAAGWEEAPDRQGVDLAVVVGCVVTGRAERDTRRKIRKAMGAKRLALSGCAPRWPAFKDVGDLAGEPDELLARLGILASGLSGRFGRARAYLAVQFGCSASCTYCVVPRTRGPSRSRPLREIIDEAKALAGAGHRELVLTGTQIGDWGREWGLSLARLIKELSEHIPSGTRLRLSSLEPTHVSQELLRAVEEGPVAHHFHIAVQSASPRVLRAMGRPYGPQLVRRVIGEIKDKFPDAGLGVDIIAGFPVETREDFEMTLAFVREMPITYAHVFSYSPRPGTPAFGLGSLPSGVVKARVRALIQAAKEKKEAWARSQVGKTLEVLVEVPGKGTSGNYLRVRLLGEVGQMRRVKIGLAQGGELWAQELLDGACLQPISQSL